MAEEASAAHPGFLGDVVHRGRFVSGGLEEAHRGGHDVVTSGHAASALPGLVWLRHALLLSLVSIRSRKT
ncbi:hypothetical protein GCM10009800_22140 [Nocardiopsis rhodophaea]